MDRWDLIHTFSLSLVQKLFNNFQILSLHFNWVFALPCCIKQVFSSFKQFTDINISRFFNLLWPYRCKQNSNKFNGSSGIFSVFTIKDDIFQLLNPNKLLDVRIENIMLCNNLLSAGKSLWDFLFFDIFINSHKTFLKDGKLCFG